MADDHPTTEELRVVQLDKLETERERADEAKEAEDRAAERAHGRRADRAAYLAEKLDEQGKALGE
jgi:hypothetical protein